MAYRVKLVTFRVIGPQYPTLEVRAGIKNAKKAPVEAKLPVCLTNGPQVPALL